MSGDTPGVVITTRDIYDKVVEVGGKVDGMLAAHERIREQVGDHEERLRAAERWRYALPVSVLLGGLSATSTLLATLL
ncbi:hypothetical protein BZB76_6132 [Actinomadura pelletieri DSM 43383]|uniref:Uncharacterized protein n=1 Tax=Actinomadura pelletieri DSM 43383 TaxID=1120940 RepID=A0A495QBC9_9ACTN|nr:hypothetical protein [Actinomadura pelletieri]RKS68993.1 hypothetical protein BZB76_6132 [Actinomadura pelletieri DSM 43383]